MKYVPYFWRVFRPVPIIMAILFAGPTFAQSNGCALLAGLSATERSIESFTPDSANTLERALDDLALRMGASNPTPPAFDRIARQPNWVAAYYESRLGFLNLFQSGQVAQAADLKLSPQFRSYAATLQSLSAAFFCSPSQQSEGSNSDGQIENHANMTLGDSWFQRALRQAKSNVLQLIASSFILFLPILFLLSVGGFIWAMVRFDESRRNLRRRYYCNIDASLVFKLAGIEVIRTARITDISRSGAAIEVDGGIPNNAIVKVTSLNLNKEMRVVRCNGRYVGAAFLRPLREIPSELDVSKERKFVPRRDYQKQMEGDAEPIKKHVFTHK